MDLNLAIKSILAEKGMRQNELQSVLGMSSKQSLSNKINNNRWTVGELAKVIDYIGGELVIRINDRDINIT